MEYGCFTAGIRLRVNPGLGDFCNGINRLLQRLLNSRTIKVRASYSLLYPHCLIAARSVFVLHKTDLNALVGAFCVYLLLGLIWAVIYQLLHIFGLATFSSSLAQEGEPIFPTLVYFSYVTLAGLGYGDIAPVSSVVRTFAYLEVVIGQFYLAVMVASLINNFSSRHTRGNDKSPTEI